jgi:hypothetical protein
MAVAKDPALIDGLSQQALPLLSLSQKQISPLYFFDHYMPSSKFSENDDRIPHSHQRLYLPNPPPLLFPNGSQIHVGFVPFLHPGDNISFSFVNLIYLNLQS